MRSSHSKAGTGVVLYVWYQQFKPVFKNRLRWVAGLLHSCAVGIPHYRRVENPTFMLHLSV